MTTLDIPDEHLAVINEALMSMPYFKAAPVIAAINAQLARQRELQRSTADTGTNADAKTVQA